MTCFTKYGLVFLALGLGSSQGIPKSLTKAYNNVDGFNRLIKLINDQYDLLTTRTAIRKAHKLPAPRRDYGVSPENMKFYLKHSLLALCKPQDFDANNCFCEGRFVEAKRFSNDTIDSQAIIGVDPANKLVVVSYRMTVGEKNWVSNYKAELVDHPVVKGESRVHEGHLEYVMSVHGQMEQDVLALLKKYKDHKLHVTGYSLGASASAISLPIWLKAMNASSLPNEVQVYTYSGPRPGNLEYARYLEALNVPIVRYTKRGDVVPHVPDQYMGFSQVGQEFHDTGLPFFSQGIVKCATDVMEDPNCALRAVDFKAFHHLTPIHRPLPTPPYC